MSDTLLESMMIRLTGDGSSYFNMMQTAQNITQQTANIINQQVQSVTRFGTSLQSHAMSVVSSLQFQVGALLGIGSAVQGLHLGVKLAADAEAAQIQFGVMLHDGYKATQMMSEIEKFAAETPLQTAGIQQAARTLLQFNVAGQNIMPLLKMIGNATGGDNERFQRMSVAFGQMSSTGRLMGQDLMQMVNAGFNPLQEIAKTTGKTMAQLHQTMEHGGISVGMVMKAFESASAAGGQFDGLMEKQSQTLGGLWSTLSDNIQIQLKRITQFIVNASNLKGMISSLSDFVQKSQPMIESWASYFINQVSRIYQIVVPTLSAVGSYIYEVVMTISGYWQSLSSTFQNSLIIFGLVVVVLGPIISAVYAFVGVIPILTGAFIVLGASIINAFGGVGPTFEYVSAAASALAEFLAPLFEPFFSAVYAGFQFATEVGVSFFKAIGQWSESSMPYLIEFATGVRDKLVDALLFAEFTFKNFGAVAQVAMVGLALGIYQLGGQIEYVLTKVAMPYLSWFNRNFQQMFEETVDNVIQLFKNLGTNLGIILGDIWEYISNGGEHAMKFELININKGIVHAIEELPKVADREIDGVESALTVRLAKLGIDLGKNFSDFKKQKNAMSQQELADRVVPKPEALDNAAREGYKEAEKIGLTMGDNVAKGLTHGTEKVQAVLAHSAKGFDLIDDYMRNKVQYNPAKTKEIAKEASVMYGPANINVAQMKANAKKYEEANTYGPKLTYSQQLAEDRRMRLIGIANQDPEDIQMAKNMKDTLEVGFQNFGKRDLSDIKILDSIDGKLGVIVKQGEDLDDPIQIFEADL